MPNSRLQTGPVGGEAVEECPSDELLFRYFEGLASAKERRAVEKHLNACDTCFSVVASVATDSPGLPTEAELLEFEKAVPLHPEAQLAKIRRYLAAHGSAPEVDRGADTSTQSVVGRANEFLGGLLGRLKGFVFPVLQPGFARVVYAVLALFVVTGGSYWGVFFYRTSYRVIRAERLMKENYTVYIAEDPRLSGDYAPSGVGERMSGARPSEKDRPYLTQAMTLTEKAIANGYESSKAKQLLAQIYIIQGQYAQADTILQQLAQESPPAASVFNDLGVLNCGKKNWETAARYFETAIQADPKINEARYNLALAKAEMGATAEAIAILNEYINLETIEGWKSAALRYKSKLQQGED